MLTPAEKLLFVFLAILSLSYAWVTFRMVYALIRRGAGEWPSLAQMQGRAVHALATWLSEGSIWKARPVTTLFHAMIAWGFTFYFLVNFLDRVYLKLLGYSGDYLNIYNLVTGRPEKENLP